jgi:hypothetical protein
MSEKNIFNTPEDELKKLLAEMRDMKITFADMSRAISRIEIRVKRAFPIVNTKTEPSLKTPTNVTDTITPQQVLLLFDELVDQAKRENIGMAKERLAAFTLADLKLMRQELGIPLGKKKSTRKVLIEEITYRINESVQLTHHFDRNRLVNEAR